jgi:hypothetical protein
MKYTVGVAPHERWEFLEAYGDKLVPYQTDIIKNAPEGAFITVTFDGRSVEILVKPEEKEQDD